MLTFFVVLRALYYKKGLQNIMFICAGHVLAWCVSHIYIIYKSFEFIIWMFQLTFYQVCKVFIIKYLLRNMWYGL